MPLLCQPSDILWLCAVACGLWFVQFQSRRPARFYPSSKPVIDLQEMPLSSTFRNQIVRDGRETTLAERQAASEIPPKSPEETGKTSSPVPAQETNGKLPGGNEAADEPSTGSRSPLFLIYQYTHPLLYALCHLSAGQ